MKNLQNNLHFKFNTKHLNSLQLKINDRSHKIKPKFYKNILGKCENLFGPTGIEK